MRPTRRTLVFIPLAGLLLGIWAERGLDLPHPWWAMAVLGAPWAVASFLAGGGTRGVATAAVFGMAVIALGLAVNVAYKGLVDGYAAIRSMESEWPYWLVLTLAVGGSMGIAGAWSRGRGVVRTLGWAAAVAVPLAETVLILIGRIGIRKAAPSATSCSLSCSSPW